MSIITKIRQWWQCLWIGHEFEHVCNLSESGRLVRCKGCGKLYAEYQGDYLLWTDEVRDNYEQIVKEYYND